MKLTWNAQDLPLTTIQDLHRCFEHIRQQEYSELWLTIEDRPSLTVLINGTFAWLMYLQNPNDAGFHSLNSHDNSSTERRMPFQLSNGQEDEYPVAWTVSLEKAFDACTYFVRTQGGRSPAIHWKST